MQKGKLMHVLTERDYEVVRKLVYEHSRIDLGTNKKELVTARLGKRLRLVGLADLSEYIAFVSGPKGEDELVHLIDAISTNHTFFFREIKHFEFMTTNALPEVVQRSQRTGEKEFRLWSAASSSGEEPYSLAIHLHDYFSRQPGWNFSIQATDISTKILEKAKQAIYPADRVRDVKPEWLRHYFQKGINQWEGHFRVKEEQRAKITWLHLNLLAPSYPFSKPFHCIWCRNVMIYFDRPTQEQLVEKLTQLLVPGGYLMIGHSESLTGIQHRLKGVKPAIYQKPL
jgi:chemotaxis protein methyltransferase CheR